MIYYVLEFQSGMSGVALCTTYTDKVAAESAYHTILAAAAQSSVPKHGAMIVTEDLFTVKKELYPHPVEVYNHEPEEILEE